MMSPRLATVVFALLIGCKAEASCGSNQLNTDKAEEVLAAALAKQAGMTPTVECPDDVEGKVGRVFDCKVTLGEAVGTYRVTQTDDEGNVSFELVEYFLMSEKIEAEIVRRIRESSGATATAQCGPRVRLSTPGTKFTCTASVANGEKLTVGVEVTSTKGDVQIKALDPE